MKNAPSVTVVAREGPRYPESRIRAQWQANSQPAGQEVKPSISDEAGAIQIGGAGFGNQIYRPAGCISAIKRALRTLENLYAPKIE